MLRLLAQLLGRRQESAGAAGEAAAWNHLKTQGWRLLDRNVRVPMGEADLVCEDPDGVVVLVEVKARVVAANNPPSPRDRFRPEVHANVIKRRKLRAIMSYLTGKNAWHGRKRRIDVVGVDLNERLEPIAVRHHRGV